MKALKIGILTGGGDVPGLNPCIKAVVDRAVDEGSQVIGLRRGWAGLLNYNIAKGADNTECVMPLDKNAVRRVAI